MKVSSWNKCTRKVLIFVRNRFVAKMKKYKQYNCAEKLRETTNVNAFVILAIFICKIVMWIINYLPPFIWLFKYSIAFIITKQVRARRLKIEKSKFRHLGSILKPWNWFTHKIGRLSEIITKICILLSLTIATLEPKMCFKNSGGFSVSGTTGHATQIWRTPLDSPYFC